LKINLLSTNISISESYEEVYKKLKQILKTASYITVNNVHTVVLAVRNKKYREALNNSILSLPDGKPLSIVAKLKGVKNISRIFGPTFMEKVIDWGREDGLKHFFFGSSKDTLDRLLNNMNIKYPRALVVGSYSPPYKDVFSNDENEFFIRLMNESGADIFWVGLGAPKQ
jgi:N-acetylglucosaminyldiphosphoundecaprenol N-acetyl-beta-D-mannosaminyltransferase